MKETQRVNQYEVIQNSENRVKNEWNTVYRRYQHGRR